MRSYSALIVLSGLVLLSGCGVFRGIEQWKCDRLGICQFGTTPSNPYPQNNCNSAGYPPATEGMMMMPSSP